MMHSGLLGALLLAHGAAAALVVAPPVHTTWLRPAPAPARSSDVECGVVARVKELKVVEKVRNFLKPLPKSDAAPKKKGGRLSKEMNKVADFADSLYDKRVSSRDPAISPSAYEIEKYCESKPEGCNLGLIEKLKSEAKALREKEAATKKKNFFSDIADPPRWSDEA